MQAGVEQSLPWDDKNDKGDIVANGVYMAVITTDGGGEGCVQGGGVDMKNR